MQLSSVVVETVTSEKAPEHDDRALARAHLKLALAALSLATVAGLCFGIVSSRAWVGRVSFLRATFQESPRPRGLEWMDGFLRQQQAVDPLMQPVPGISLSWLSLVVWVTGFATLGLLLRTLSADLPFVLPGQQRRGVRSVLTVWIEPRLVARGIMAALFCLWASGLAELFMGGALVNTNLRRLLFGGIRVQVLSWELIQNPLLMHWLVSVSLALSLFIAWSSDGLFTTRPFDFLRAFRPAAHGLLAGTALAIVSMPFTSLGSQLIREYLRASGPLSRTANSNAVWLTVVMGALGGAAFAALALGLSKLAVRSKMLCLGLFLTAFLAGMQFFFYRNILVWQLHFGKELAAGIGGPQRTNPLNQLPESVDEFKRVAVLTNNRARCPSNAIAWRTAAGTDATEAATSRVEQFVLRNRYRTTLLRPAFVQLFDAAALAFDRDRAFRVCLQNLRLNPVLTQTGLRGRMAPQPALLISEALPDMPVSEESRKLLAELCDENTYVLKDATSTFGLLGDAWLRQGDVKRAREFYEKSLLSEEERKVKLSEPPGIRGTVRGMLRVNGVPTEDVQVGAVSTLKWLTLVQPGANAFSLRAICVGDRTDANGRFELNHLGKGQYYIVVALPPKLVKPEDEVEARNQPGVISILGGPVQYLGTTEIQSVPSLRRRDSERAT